MFSICLKTWKDLSPPAWHAIVLQEGYTRITLVKTEHGKYFLGDPTKSGANSELLAFIPKALANDLR